MSCYRDADRFCKRNGLSMVPVSVTGHDASVGIAATCELTFKAVQPGSAEDVPTTLYNASLYNPPAAVFPTVAQPARSTIGPYAATGTGHWIKENIDRGRLILLEDSSLWQMDRLERIDAALWLKVSAITVLESSNGSVGYDYLLVNTEDKEKCHAKFLGINP